MTHITRLLRHDPHRHVLPEAVVRQHMPLQVALRHEGLIAALHIALVLMRHLMHALHVHGQIAVPHERLAAVFVRTCKSLVVLVMAADVHLQSAVRRVLLVTARVGALKSLGVTLARRNYFRVARVDPAVLTQVLRVVERLSAVREIAYVLLLARVVVNVHVRVQIRLPGKLSAP